MDFRDRELVLNYYDVGDPVRVSKSFTVNPVEYSC